MSIRGHYEIFLNKSKQIRLNVSIEDILFQNNTVLEVITVHKENPTTISRIKKHERIGCAQNIFITTV